MINVTQWLAEIGSFYCSSKIIPSKRKFNWQRNSFDSITFLPFFIVLAIFNLIFLICWFILSKTLKFLYTKFLDSVANITAKFRLHARINVLIQLNNAFSLYFYPLCIIQSGDNELNPGPKSSLLSGLWICHWKHNSLVAHNFSKGILLEAYNSVHNFDIIRSHSWIQLFNWIDLIY